MRIVHLALFLAVSIQTMFGSEGGANDLSLTTKVTTAKDNGRLVGKIQLTLRNLTKDQFFIFNGVGNYGFGAWVYYVGPDRKRVLLKKPMLPSSTRPITQTFGVPMELKPGDAESSYIELNPEEAAKVRGRAVICRVTIQNKNLSLHCYAESPPQVFGDSE